MFNLLKRFRNSRIERGGYAYGLGCLFIFSKNGKKTNKNIIQQIGVIINASTRPQSSLPWNNLTIPKIIEDVATNNVILLKGFTIFL